MKLPEKFNLPANIPQAVLKLFNGKSKIRSIKVEKFSPHISKFAGFTVDQVSKKSDLLPDILKLRELGLSVQKISEMLGISKSYIYKLLSKKK